MTRSSRPSIELVEVPVVLDCHHALVDCRVEPLPSGHVLGPLLPVDGYTFIECSCGMVIDVIGRRPKACPVAELEAEYLAAVAHAGDVYAAGKRRLERTRRLDAAILREWRAARGI